MLRFRLTLFVPFFAMLLASWAAWAQPVEVIPLLGGSWRYNQSNNLDGVMWMAPGYDDTQPLWQEGPALLSNDTGNGTINPMIGRVINGPRVAAQGVVQHAYYFRNHFMWNAPARAFTTLNFNVRLDDGTIIFLNGTEIHRIRVNPATAVQFAAQNFANALPCGGDPDCGDDLSSIILTNGAPLVQGANVLAAIVFQNGTDSSDITFGASLSVTPPVAPTIVDATQPSNRVAIADRLTTLSVIAAGLPASCQWYFQPMSGGGFAAVADGPGISGAQTTALSISNMAPANAGSYFCVLTNGAGMTNSRTALVQFTIDTNPPVVVRAAGNATFDKFVLEFDEPLEVSVATDTANYTVNGVNPTVAALAPDGRTVTLDSVHMPDTDYTIAIPDSGLSDPVGNFMSATQFVVHSYILTSCGGMLFEVYATGAGNNVPDLTNHVDYPNRPSKVVRTNGFTSNLAWAGLGDTDPSREGYGARMRGLFFPPESGLWRLYLWADDGSQLYFNPNGPDASGKQLVLNRTACCGDFNSANSRTVAFPLQVGRAYYVEALYKEGVGGDYGQVAARLDGQPTPTTAEFIPGDQLGFTAIPPGIVGPLLLTQAPANASVEMPNRATFSAAASATGAPFLCFQWQKAEAGSGVFNDLPGVIGPSYTTPPTTVVDDNGDQYRVVINAISGSITSAPALLTVTADVTRPQVVKVVPTSATTLAVVYSEPMSVDATDTVNYSLNGGVTVSTATVNGSNPNRIDLVTSGMTLGDFYTLTIPPGGGSMTDPSGNAISPNPTVSTFRAQTYAGDPATVKILPTTGALPLGALTNRGILVRFVQVSAVIANGNAITEQMLGGVYPSAISPLPNLAPVPLHLETNVINYNKDGPTSMDGSLIPDDQFPGFGSVPLAALDNIAFEAVCYLELRRGLYRSIVRSDDGFRLTTGLSAEDPLASFVFGQFDGGRGVDDTPLLDFCVQQDGLYPVRLSFEEGQGGAAIEWKIQDLENPIVHYGVNGGTVAPGFPGGSPNAYLPPCVDPVLHIQVNGNSIVVTWPLAGGGNLYQLQSASALANPPSATVWNNVSVIPQTSGTNKRAALPNAGGSVFFRLFRPGPDCSP